MLTRAVMLAGLPCAKPWDLQFGEQFDVLVNGEQLLSSARSGLVRHGHFGTPCQSMTFARDPQLRCAECPWGIEDLQPHQLDLVKLGNSLAIFTAEMCLCLWAAGATFSIESPALSWLWVLQPLQRLRALPGVEFLHLKFSDFLVPFTKPTLLLHNVPKWHLACQEVATWQGELCVLRGQVWYKGQKVVSPVVVFEVGCSAQGIMGLTPGAPPAAANIIGSTVLH